MSPARLLIALILFARLVPSQTPADALAQQQRGDYPAAESLWRQLVAANPRDFRYWTSLGASIAHQNRYPEAIAAYRKALALSPADPQTNLNLGLAYFKLGQFHKAIPPLQSASRTLPEAAPQAQLLLGMSFYGEGDAAQAVPHLELAQQADLANTQLQLVLARAYLQAGAFDKAQAQFARMLAANADSAQVHLLLGEAYDGLGKQQAALDEFRIAANAPHLPDAHFSLGYVLWRDKNYAAAADEFRQELKLNPSHQAALAYLGDTLLKSGDAVAAKTLLQQSIAAKDSLWIAHYDLGIIAEKARNYPVALEQLQKAAAFNNTRPEIHYHLAQVYKATGRATDAQRELHAVSTLHAGQTDDLVTKVTGNSPTKE